MSSPTSAVAMRMANGSLAFVRVLGVADWQQMSIKAGLNKPTPLVAYRGGDSDSVLTDPHDTSFQLVVYLSDDLTGRPIPYAEVKATITTAGGRVVYQGLETPVISPHASYYASDVALPSSGSYRLRLTIEGVLAARHREYSTFWMHPHSTVYDFKWQSGTL